MKKIFVIMIALLLAAPAMSFAGSATSRFDMTIGGNINFNFGYVTNNLPADSFHAPMRQSSSTATNINAEYGNVRYSTADSQINFLSRGPDTFGAKTMGFLQIDFRGGNTGNIVGGAQLQYAFVKFDWANAYLVAGKSGPELLSAYARKFIIAGDATSTEGIGGIRPIQIAARYNLTKNFNILLGVIQHASQDGTTANQTSYGRSELPAIETEFGFSSDACGKIGPDMLKFGLGFIGAKEKKSIMTNTAVTGSQANNVISDKTVNVWMAGLRAFVPIIPEKKENKANALSFSGIAYVGQNAFNYLGTPAPGVGSYWRPNPTGLYNGLPNDAVAPTMYGGFLQLTYYISNETYVNAQYGVLKHNYSSAARNTSTAANQTLGQNETDWKGPNMINQFRVYGASIFHDPSPSVRIGLEWLRFYSNYNGYGTGTTPGSGTTAVTAGTGNLDSYGKMDQYKAMVMYFF